MQLSQKDLAEALGLSPRRIRQLSADKGIFRLCSDKKYNLSECVQDYIKFKVESETERGNDLDYWEEKAKHEEAKRKITQMKLARMKRETFDVTDVEDAWAELLIGFKEELQALPHKLAPLLVGMEDMGEIDRTVEVEINNTLKTLSTFDINNVSSQEDMTGDDEDEEEYQEIIEKTSSTPPTGKKPNRKRMGRRKS